MNGFLFPGCYFVIHRQIEGHKNYERFELESTFDDIQNQIHPEMYPTTGIMNLYAPGKKILQNWVPVLSPTQNAPEVKSTKNLTINAEIPVPQTTVKTTSFTGIGSPYFFL